MNRKLFDETIKCRNVSKLKISMEAGISPSDFYQAYRGLKPFFPFCRESICRVLDLKEEDLFPEERMEGE